MLAGTKIRVLKKSVAMKIRNPKDIPVTKEFEELANIEDVRAGDYVLTRDEHTEKSSYRKVTELFRHEVKLLYRIVLSDGTRLDTTWNHPLYVTGSGVRDRGSELRAAGVFAVSLLGASNANTEKQTASGKWTEAKDIRKGYSLMNSHGKNVTVASVEVLHVPETKVFNFEVEGTHTYFAGEQGVWVHNYDAELKYDREMGMLKSLGQKAVNGVSNLFGGEYGIMEGFQDDNQMKLKEIQKDGALAELKARKEFGLKLTASEEDTLKKMQALADRKSAMIKKYSNGKEVMDFTELNKNPKAREEYLSILKEEFSAEKKRSMELMKEWTDSGRTAVPLTPYTKKLLKEQVDQFGNQFQALDLDKIRLSGSGLMNSYYKLKQGINKLTSSSFLDGVELFFKNPLYLGSDAKAQAPNGTNTIFDYRTKVTLEVRSADKITSPIGFFDPKVVGSVLENRYSTGFAGGFDQLDQYDIPLLAHELTHKIQQQSAGYQEAVSLHSKNVKDENRYGINEKTLHPMEATFLKRNPDYFIGKEILLKNKSGDFISIEQRADINRVILMNKYSHLLGSQII